MDGINDVFIQNTSGIPYIARCYGGNYCQTQPEHELVTGFFAAINSFKGELGQTELNNVIYNDINLIFETKNDLLVVFNVDRGVDESTYREIAQKLRDRFFEEYSTDGELPITARQTYTDYIDWMDEQVGQGMADLRPLIERVTPRGFLDRLKSIF